jgi:hypothetical protein
VIMDEKKKDFVAMFSHHVVTILLVILSGLGNMHRVGAVIMLTFDICDILLEMAKISHKVKLHDVSHSVESIIYFFSLHCHSLYCLYLLGSRIE